MTEWTQSELTSLNRILANLYPMIGDGVRVAKGVGLATSQIAFDNKAINNWFAIVQRAKQETKADALVAFALDENPGDEALLQAKQHAPPPPVEGPATTSGAARRASSKRSLVTKARWCRSAILNSALSGRNRWCASSVPMAVPAPAS